MAKGRSKRRPYKKQTIETALSPVSPACRGDVAAATEGLQPKRIVRLNRSIKAQDYSPRTVISMACSSSGSDTASATATVTRLSPARQE